MAASLSRRPIAKTFYVHEVTMADMSRQNPFQAALALANLGFNWNSYGSLPVSEQAIQSACVFAVDHLEENLRAQAVVMATQHGGVQLEWHIEGLDLEIAWGTDGSFTSVFRNDESGRLSNLDFKTPEDTTEVIASYAIGAAAELASKEA